ncbi:MAG TPA: serine/threonine-protein kinase [Polyangia bacterium]|nr:serine/threonine-protein kinase [Polyangia bacterium]
MEESHTVIEGAPTHSTGAIALARGTLLAERYEITRLLGRGGAGVVMQARDRVLGEDIAVKVLRPEHGAEPRWIDRLAREVKLARQIRHANVCRVFDFGQSDGHSFLVMELATSGSLRDELARDEWPDRRLGERLADARAVADGLAAVHAAGILHRDVTPQNVLRMGDGRLVVSDFGLATDADPTASSIHGGTVAYMAPEIARGERASEASDVWALGVIVHEIVFGRRPSWREGRHGSTLAAGDAALGPAELRVLEICQRCTQERARQRPTAVEVGALLSSAAAMAGRAGPRGGRRGRLAVLGAVAVAVVAGASARAFLRARASVAAASLEIPLRGEPASWTVSARVAAIIEGRVHALALLPGGDGVRVTWGDSRLTEDVDLATGARRPAPGPTAPDRPGAPALSPDGSSIAVEGYAAEGRPFVFLGPASPGAQLVPVTAAADPSLASQPRWLAGGRAFVYDADVRNVGVFSLDTNRATILPAFPARPSFTTFKAAVADRVLVAGITDGGESQIAVFSWPAMEIVSRFDLPAFADEWQSRDGHHLIGLAFEHARGAEIVSLDLDTRDARRLGTIAGQQLAALALAEDALVFASFHYGGDIWIDDAAGGRLVTKDLHAKEMARGGGRVLASVERGGVFRVVELDVAGHELGVLSPGPRDEAPSILPDGRVWTYVRRAGDAPGLYRCRFGGACGRISEAVLQYATVSPDGARVAYVDPLPQGLRARIVPLGGGPARDVGDASSYCRPVWSSARTLWISRRAGGAPEWIEVDVGDAGGAAPDARPTGRTLRGARDCSDGLPDPAAPMRDGAKIVIDWRSELRVQPMPR